MQKIKIVLGSQSPRRKELLKASFLNYEIVTSNIEENSSHKIPSDIAIDLAGQKAQAVANMVKDKYKLVIGADTIVVHNNNVLGKPKDRQEASNMLMQLSGSCHEVYTGVSFVMGEKSHSFYERTLVFFRPISTDLLNFYLDTKDSMDKAGAYGIQGEGLSFIEKIEGSYSNVVGLPIDRVIIEIKKFLGKEEDTSGEWREIFK